MEQICKSCFKSLSYDNFFNNNTYKLGITRVCKGCIYIKTREKIKEYKIKNKEIIKQKNTEYNNRPKSKEIRKIWMEKNQDKVIASKNKNKKNKSISDAKYRANNIDLIKANQKEYCRKNRKELSEKRRKRRNTDPVFNLTERLRNRLRFVITNKRYTKHAPTIKVIGISYEDLKIYIERLFTKGMTWSKLLKGEIHIDHIIPLSIAKTEEELLTLCHYTNLQPLWALDNLTKSNKVPAVQMKIAI